MFNIFKRKERVEDLALYLEAVIDDIEDLFARVRVLEKKINEIEK